MNLFYKFAQTKAHKHRLIVQFVFNLAKNNVTEDEIFRLFFPHPTIESPNGAVQFIVWKNKHRAVQISFPVRRCSLSACSETPSLQMGTRFKAGDFLDQFNWFNAWNIRTYMQRLSGSLYHWTDFKSLVPFFSGLFYNSWQYNRLLFNFLQETLLGRPIKGRRD